MTHHHHPNLMLVFFVTLDTCNTAKKLVNDLVVRIDKVVEEKKLAPLIINIVLMKTIAEPCKKYQRNISLGGFSNKMHKHLQNMLRAKKEASDKCLKIYHTHQV